MSDFDVMFPVPDGRRNADDMGMPICAPTKHHAQDYAALIHYPEHWDTAAYPTLESAISETLAWAGCSACKEPEAYGLTPNK